MPVSLTPKLVTDGQTNTKERHLTVADYMVKNVVTFEPELDINKAIDSLVKLRVSGAPVVNKAGKLIGMLSEKDCLSILIKRAYHSEHSGSVSEYMSTFLTTVAPEMELVDLAEMFANTNYRRLPVVKNDKLVGQISRRDLLIAIQENHKMVGA